MTHPNPEALFLERSKFHPTEPDDSGDFDSPALLALRDAWEALLEGAIEEEDIIGVIHQVGMSLEIHLDTLQGQLNQGTSKIDDPIFATIAEAFVDHLHATKVMLKEFQVRPAQRAYKNFFERGYQIAQAATNRMMKAHEVTLESIEALSWMKCPECGTRNRVGNRNCNNCLAVLPLRLNIELAGRNESFYAEEVQASSKRDLELTTNYLKVERAVNRWYQDSSRLSALVQVVDSVRAETVNHLAENEVLLNSTTEATEQERCVVKALYETQAAVQASLDSLIRLSDRLENPEVRTAVVRVCMLDFEKVSRNVARSYYALKNSYESIT